MKLFCVNIWNFQNFVLLLNHQTKHKQNAKTMTTQNITTGKEKEGIKAINEFRNILSEKRNDMKSVTYKTVQNFFEQMNALLDCEYFKFEANKGTYHSYQIKDRLRYNDSYKDGQFIKMAIGSESYEYHTKQPDAAWNMNNFVQNALAKGGVSIIVEIRKFKITK